MNCLITGAAGFIGSHLLNYLNKQSCNTIPVDNLSTGTKNNITDILQNNLKLLDLSNSNSIKNITDYITKYNINVIFHLAALPSVQQSIDCPSISHANNLTSTINLLEAIKNTSVQKIVFSSTSAVYGDCNVTPTDEQCPTSPMSPYAAQKLMSEQYLKLFSELYGISVVCLRYFNVYGKKMTSSGAYRSVISIFREQILNNVPLTIVGDGEQRRDFIYVEDVVTANYQAAVTNLPNRFSIYNVGYGKNFSVNEIANAFKANTVYISNRIEPRISLCNNFKIKKDLNWNPSVSVLDWIKNTL